MSEAGRYVVRVDENSAYMDRDASWTRGTYATVDDALAECRRMVDADLAELHQPGMSSAELIASYREFGRDPFVIALGNAPPTAFSAWDYAERRAVAICGGRSR